MNDVRQYICLGIIIALILAFVRTVAPDFITIVRIVAIIILTLPILKDIGSVFDMVKTLYSDLSGDDIYFTIILKIFGIAFIVEIASNLARDVGEESIAKALAFAGKAVILCLSGPIIIALISIISDLL